MEVVNVENFLRELNSFGYKSNVFQSISLIATVKKGYKEPFPVRDQTGKKILATQKMKDGDRVFAMVRIIHWRKKDGNEGICFELLLPRFMKMDEHPTKKRKPAKTMDLLFNK
jgi:hypothetical protein